MQLTLEQVYFVLAPPLIRPKKIFFKWWVNEDDQNAFKDDGPVNSDGFGEEIA